jgi:transcriptional regulator with XRE-family HTH domain
MTPQELKDWRTAAHLTQGELAALLLVDHMTVSRWERGLRAVPPFLHLALKYLESQRPKAARKSTGRASK